MSSKLDVPDETEWLMDLMIHSSVFPVILGV